MILDEVAYRRASLDDVEELAAFGSQSFVDAYADLCAPGSLALHVLRTYGPERQRAELLEAGTWAVLGEREGELVAAALLRKRNAPAELPGDIEWGEIVRFCVAMPYWRTGVSSGLMRATIRSMLSEGVGGAWLQIWEHGYRAVRFYRKWGFLQVGETGVQLGPTRLRNLIMARSLRPR